MDVKKNWEKIKDKIKKDYNISDIAYKVWIAPLQFFEEKNNVVTIFVEEKQFIEYLTQNYRNSFIVCISEIMKKEYDVKFISYSDIQNKDNEESISNSFEYNKNSNINPNFTFDNFIVGNSNKFAHACAVAISDNPGLDGYNPFFIYSGVGLGKTHLMHAIGNAILNKDPSKKVLYITAEEFCNEIVNAIATGKSGAGNLTSISELRNKYRNADLLLIDDIQFIIGKEKTQEEFFYTFNTLVGKNKQVVLTSDKHPKELDKLDDRYISRFISGVFYEIEKPDYEMRLAILKSKMDYYKLTKDNIPDSVLDYIASNIKTNIRELEGCFNRIKQYIWLSGEKSITLETAKEEINIHIYKDKKKEIKPKDIIEFVADHFSITPQEITGTSRKKEISIPRHIAMYLCRQYTNCTLEVIAKEMGGKDHSTVCNGVEHVQKLLKKDKEITESVDFIIKKINPDIV